MCIICVEWEKGKMTAKEALNALGEMMDPFDAKDNKHYLEAYGKILDKEVPMNDTDPALDKAWQDNRNDDES